MLPEDIRPTYEALIGTEEKGAEWRIVKAADKISAYIKCMEERKMGNREFAEAETSTLSAIRRHRPARGAGFHGRFCAGLWHVAG